MLLTVSREFVIAVVQAVLSPGENERGSSFLVLGLWVWQARFSQWPTGLGEYPQFAYGLGRDWLNIRCAAAWHQRTLTLWILYHHEIHWEDLTHSLERNSDTCWFHALAVGQALQHTELELLEDPVVAD